jgi:hypothetical protein
MTKLHDRLLRRPYLLAGALALSACTSGIKAADQACSPSRVTAAAFADCLRSNYATLTGGASDQSDLGGLYLAAAELQAAMVANGSETDAQAMFALADYRMRVLAPMEQKRRDADLQKVLQALQSSGQGQGSQGSQKGSSPYSRTSSR